MKKAVVLISALFLIAGLTFAQMPQKPAKSTEPAKTEQVSKDAPSDCPKAAKKECSMGKDSKGCCAHGKKSSEPAKTDPEKK
ncbi:MAG: hypothetical protein V1733_07360 [bacterium]